MGQASAKVILIYTSCTHDKNDLLNANRFLDLPDGKKTLWIALDLYTEISMTM